MLDPCMGSGHFLREAFDILVAMYREQQPTLGAAAVVDTVLAEHLHGIDIDPRREDRRLHPLCARLELVRDERRAKRQPGSGRYTPRAGFEQYAVAWGMSGERIVAASLSGTRFQNTEVFFQPGLCYSLIARGSLGVRLTEDNAYDGAGLAIQCAKHDRLWIAAVLNARLATYAARLMAQDIRCRGGYVERIPAPPSAICRFTTRLRLWCC